MSRLHEKGAIHGDIKPSNLLLCPDEEMRFCDFGDAVVDRGGHPSCHECAILIPVYVQDDSNDVIEESRKSLCDRNFYVGDIYTGHIPFADTDDDLVDSVVKSGGRPDIA